MDAVFERDLEERDRTHEPRLFETVPLACPPSEAARRVTDALPWLVREGTPEGVAFRNPNRAGTPVVAAIAGPRPGHTGSELRYRRAYRAGPPLGTTYDAPAGRQVLAALEPCLWSAPESDHSGEARARRSRVPRRWQG